MRQSNIFRLRHKAIKSIYAKRMKEEVSVREHVLDMMNMSKKQQSKQQPHKQGNTNNLTARGQENIKEEKKLNKILSILTSRDNTSMNISLNNMKHDNRLTSLTTMETVITLLPDTPLLPPRTFSNTLIANPIQLNIPSLNPVRGSLD